MSREITKPSIFDESSSESDNDGPPQMQMKKAPMGPSLMEKRKAKHLQEKALAEDPTIFQYDELYDEMENKREEEKQVKSKEPKKARYITKLMETAERRKLENELRVERQVQKEREAEGEEFKDKEAFVTTAYRKRLEEMRKLEEKNKRDDYLEAIGDVTKQKDLDGFYRHLYEQKMGTSKEVKKPVLEPEITNAGGNVEEEGSVAYKPIKSGKLPQQRAYRRRRASEEEAEEEERNKSLQEEQNRKVHLTNNMDADSDFSIDDSSSESEDEKDNEIKTKENDVLISPSKDSKISKTPSNTIALNLNSLKPEEQNDNKMKTEEKLPVPFVAEEKEPSPPPKHKRTKAEIWGKRTVGEVFVAAVQRYHERKAARNQA